MSCLNEDLVDVDESLNLCETAFENGIAFVNEFEKWDNDVGKFLHRDNYISVRSTSVDVWEQEFNLLVQKDIAGVVIEWNNLSGIGVGVSHLQVVSKDPLPMKRVYGELKKHIDLRQFSTAARKSLKSCVGYRLFSGADGWETWLCFLPRRDLSVEYSCDIIEKVAFRAVNRFKTILQSKLKGLVGTCVAKNTLHKNTLSNLSKLRILPNDQDEILRVVDDALNVFEIDVAGLEKKLITYRFGDKFRGSLKLPVGREAEVKKITVHIGVDVSVPAQDNDSLPIELFGSKHGLQEIVGERGNLIASYSFSECCNFQ